MIVTRKQKILLAVLGALLAGVWGRVLFGPFRASDSTPPARETQEIVSKPMFPTPPSLESDRPEWGPSPFLSDREGRTKGPDPFSGPSEESGYVLSGILWDAQRPSAVINNRVVEVGDQLDGWEVVEIQKNQVILSDGASTQALTSQ